MKVLKNYIYSAGYQLLIMIVPLITTPYVNRVLGPHGIGVNTYTNTIIQYFILFGGLGIALYGNRQIAYVRDNREQLVKSFWEIQIIHTLCIIISTIIFLIYLIAFANYKWYMLLQFVNLIAAAFDISWFFQGIEDFKIIIVRNTIIKLLCVALIFILIHSEDQIGIYILIYALSTLLGNFTLWPSLRKYLNVKIKIKHLRPIKHILPAISFFVPEVAVQIYQTLNKTILGLIVGMNAAGFYYNSDTIIKILLSLVTAFSTVMLPHVANKFSHGDIDQVKIATYRSFDVVTCISVALMFGIASISLKFSILFFGNRFSAVGPAMMLESPVIYFASVSTVLGGQFLIPIHQVGLYTKSLILGAIVSIVCNLTLIQPLHLYGAILSTVFAEVSILIYQIYIVNVSRQLDTRKLFHGSLKYFFAGLLMFISVFLLDRYLNSSIVAIVLEIILGIFIYVFLIFMFRTEVATIVLDILKVKKVK